MAYNFSKFKEKTAGTAAWFKQELSGLRTGKASPALLDNVMVESYGSKMPIAHVAAVSVEGPRSLMVTPWDKSQVKDIEKAIAAANLGVSTSPDSAGVRVNFPDLTEDRRKMVIKTVKEKLEEGKIAVRKEREETWNDIQAKEKEGAISEDDKFRSKDELQKFVDEANKVLEDLATKKEKEIMGQ